MGCFFSPPLSHPNREKKKDTTNANIKEAGEDWNLKKKCVCTDISRASPCRYEKDILIQGGITDSKKVNKIVFSYHVIMCHFLSTESNVFFFFKLK